MHFGAEQSVFEVEQVELNTELEYSAFNSQKRFHHQSMDGLVSNSVLVLNK